MKETNRILDRSWAEIDLDAIGHNMRALRNLVWKNTEIMAVVKADAYGHGVENLAGTLLENGASRLAVSLLDEALQLRKLGIDCPILVLNYTDPRRAQEIVKNNITQSVYSMDLAEAINKEASYYGKIAKVHVAVDTGMNRVGVRADKDAVEFITQLSNFSHIFIEGIFTHFATADSEDSSFTRKQFDRFLELNEKLKNAGLRIPLKHCCNSAATLRFPEMHMDLVRPGLILYGILPDNCGKWANTFYPAMSLKSRLIMVKEIEEGESVSYGRKFTAKKKAVIGTVPIGYADGYSRKLSGKAKAIVAGKRVDVIGSVCMDSCMLDLSSLDKVPSPGDEVVLLGSEIDPDGIEVFVTADELATICGTISYEIICLIGKRIPRVYVKGRRIVDITSKIRS